MIEPLGYMCDDTGKQESCTSAFFEWRRSRKTEWRKLDPKEAIP